MKKEKQTKLKEILVVCFVILSIVLVVFQWVNNLTDMTGDANPAFVRPTPEAFQVDPDAYENWNQLEETPAIDSGTPAPSR